MEIIKSGKTVEEAIAAALEEAGIDREDAEIEIIDEGNKGFLGIGSKEATVKVTKKQALAEDIAKDFLYGIFEKMGMFVKIDVKTEGENLNIDLSGENMGLLIGHRGETLTSLQYLTNLAVNRSVKERCRVLLDTENYKEKREETLKRLAKKIADKTLKYRRNVTLEPMTPYERRIIHSALQDYDNISTYSIGEEPNRKIVVAYKK